MMGIKYGCWNGLGMGGIFSVGGDGNIVNYGQYQKIALVEHDRRGPFCRLRLSD